MEQLAAYECLCEIMDGTSLARLRGVKMCTWPESRDQLLSHQMAIPCLGAIDGALRNEAFLSMAQPLRRDSVHQCPLALPIAYGDCCAIFFCVVRVDINAIFHEVSKTMAQLYHVDYATEEYDLSEMKAWFVSARS
jgi:hypothetical protein